MDPVPQLGCVELPVVNGVWTEEALKLLRSSRTICRARCGAVVSDPVPCGYQRMDDGPQLPGELRSVGAGPRG